MKKIINLAVLAHVDAGKTTLTEDILYRTGAIRSVGRVDDGNAQTDFLAVERERGISVRAAQTTVFYGDTQINLIDTPGHVDFAGEVERSLAAVDGAVLVVSAVEGVQSHTETIVRALDRMGLPFLIFINKVDRTGSRTEEIVTELAELLAGRPFLYHHVVDEGEKTCRLIVPADRVSRMLECVADFDDEAADAYLAERTVSEEELGRWFSSVVQKRHIVPVTVGVALSGLGVGELLDMIVQFLPNAPVGEEEPLSATVFRIEHDKTMGRVAHVRVFGGVLHARDVVTYPPRSPLFEERQDEKISQIRKFNGQKYLDVGRVGAGDIAALCGLQEARVFDYLGEKPPCDAAGLANPYLCVKVSPVNEADLTALVRALGELEAEDPLLSVKWEKTEREVLVNITGRIELEILEQLILDRYGLSVHFSPPSVIYRETVAGTGDAFASYTMPKPCWAKVHFRFEPLPRGSGVVYDGGNVPHNQLFYKYQEHIRRSFFESLGQGMFGWEVTDLKATLIGGEHHTIHTHPLDFFVATPMAVMNGLRDIGTLLLEPYLRVTIRAGEEYLGRILSDLSKMRGEFDSPVITKGEAMLEASIPVATSMDYPIALASLTGGRGYWRATFEGYRECAPELGQRVPYRGVCPLDRSKWILYKRGAYQEKT